MTAQSEAAATEVGLVGLGAMGARIAERLLSSGYRVLATDVAPEAVAAFGSLGGIACASAREIADRVEIVLVSLPSPSIVQAVAEELMHGERIRLYADLSTTGVKPSRVVAELLTAAGIDVVDAPVSGGPAGAAEGQLAMMVAGADVAIDRLNPIFEHLARRIYRIGETPGQAQAVKLINNVISATAIAVTSEGLAVGALAGVDPHVLIDVINSSTGRSQASEEKFPKNILTRSFDYGFRFGLMTKDVRLYLDTARDLGVPTMVAGATGSMLDLGMAAGLDSADQTALVTLIEGWVGRQVTQSDSSDAVR